MGGIATHRLGCFNATGGGGGGGSPGDGVLVYCGSDVTLGSTSNVTYDSEAYDGASFHDTGSNTDRLTIPASGVTRGRFIVNTLMTTGDERLTMLKGAATFFGRSLAVNVNIAGDDAQNLASAIVSVSAADYFAIQSTATTFRDFETWASFEPIDSALKGALVKKTGTQAISSGTNTVLTFDAEEYDTDGFHDNVTNNTRLTVPSGVSLVRLSASCITSGNVSSSFQGFITLKKGGSVIRGSFAKDTMGDGSTMPLCATSAILAVSAGDYFELEVFYGTGVTVNTANETWFQIEEVPAARKYAVVYKSGTQAITANTPAVLAFGAELADTDGFHDNSTNNSRLTVPSGCTRARLSFNVRTPSNTGEQQARVLKNGAADIPGLPSYACSGTGTDNLNGFGAWVSVTAGDYFELQFASDTGQTLSTDNETWFCIECT